MIGAYFVACMLSNHSICTESFTPLENPTPFQCSHTAQIMMAKHLSEKPGWYIERYGCRKTGGGKINT